MRFWLSVYSSPLQPLNREFDKLKTVCSGLVKASDWELRVEKYRVFYDVVIEGDSGVVQIKAVGHKEHNTLYIGGREVQL